LQETLPEGYPFFFIQFIDCVPLLAYPKPTGGLSKRRLAEERLVYVKRHLNEFGRVHSAIRRTEIGLVHYDVNLQRFDVAEVFPYDAPDLFCSLLRIPVEEDLDNVALLRFEC